MFDPSSRYAAIPTAAHALPDGRTITYALRRILPQPSTLTILSVATLAPTERLDNFAARTLGDPLLYWRICDANPTLDLTDPSSPGQALAIPLPAG